MREIHKKINPEYFEKILNGEKTFEFRVADFECAPGDILVLEEWEYPSGINSIENRHPTGRTIRKKVGYVGYTKDFTWLTERPDVAADYEKLGAQIISLIDESETPATKKNTAINKDFVAQWLAKLQDYWLNKDVEKAAALFQNTSFYQETPFQQPYTTFAEIAQEWRHVQDENIKTITFNILAIDRNTVIVEWYLEQNDDVLDGIYEIKFNDHQECIYFKSWEMTK